MDSEQVGKYWEENATTWTRHARAGYDIYRDALNTPAFLELLPNIEGLLGLDIGCGEGSNTRKLAERGASMRAIDIAPTFIQLAREQESEDPRGIQFFLGDATDLPFKKAQFDFLTAFMSLMDIPDQEQVLQEMHRVAKPDAFMQFSILHPCFVPPGRRNIKDDTGVTREVAISGYFSEMSGEVETWHFHAAPQEELAHTEPFKVPRFHRTLSGWVNILIKTGWTISAMAEPAADDKAIKRYPRLAATTIAPLFMIFQCRKS